MDRCNIPVRKSLAEHKGVVKHWRTWGAAGNHYRKVATEPQPEWYRPSQGLTTPHESDKCRGGLSSRFSPRDIEALRIAESSVAQKNEELHSREDALGLVETKSVIHMKSVGEVRRLFRTRLHQEDIFSKQLVSQPKRRSPPFRLNANASQSASEICESIPSTDLLTFEEEARVAVLRLDPVLLLSSQDSREGVLSSIRRDLSSGRPVLLTASYLSDGVPLPEIKLCLQELCSASLLFCTRDQSVLPVVDGDKSRVYLKLIPRATHSFLCTQLPLQISTGISSEP